ncbi:MAG: TonB-dependent receptor plug domain-containing protein [Bacteroidia bacterium]
MKKYILLTMSIFTAFCAFSQNAKFTGKVVDQNNQPLEKAYIEVSGGKNTITDANGEFSVDCADSLLLKITFVGFDVLTKKTACTSKMQTFVLSTNQNTLDLVEITLTSNPNKSQLEQPLSIVKINDNDIKRGNGLFMDDAVNTNIPGVTMNRRTQSAGQQLNIRGYRNGYGNRGISSNFDMQGVKAYLNGIPLTDAEGITIMDDIDFNSVQNVEVVKGPSGTLYGLAIAGVVNLQTQKAEKNTTTVGQDVLMGSYGLMRTTSRVAIGGENSSLLINYGHQNFDGFMVHTQSTKDFMNVMGDFTLNKKQSLTTYLGYSNSYDQRNGELTIEQYDSNDYSGNPKYIKNDAHSAVRTFRAGVGHTYKFNKTVSNSTTFFGSGQSIDQSSAGGWTDKYPVNFGVRSTLEAKLKQTENLTLSGITGLELQQMFAQTIGYNMVADSTNLNGYNVITGLKSNQATNAKTSSYFTQWTALLKKGISINAGVGLSNMSIKLDDRLWANTNNHPNDADSKTYETSFTNLLAKNIGINKKFGNTSVYANYSDGYKTPVGSNILITYTGQLNKTLKPEYGSQIEIGTKSSLMDNRLFYTIAAFNVKFQDKFTAQTVQDPQKTATLYSYLVNGGALNNKGLELLVRYDALKSKDGILSVLRPFANLTLSNFKYENFQFETITKTAAKTDSTVVYDYSGKSVAGVAPLVFNVGIDVESKAGFFGNLTYNHRSIMPFTSDGVNEAAAYNLLNAKMGYKKRIKNLEALAFAGATNITGTKYYNMVFVNQLPDAYIPAPNEINFFGGLNLKYYF